MVHFFLDLRRKMQYHPDDFLRLMEEVERQGGVHQPDRCEPRKIRYKMPTPDGRASYRDAFGTGCGTDSRFTVPYDPAGRSLKERQEMLNRGGGFITACAVDDNMGLWPRFQHVIQED